MKNRDKKHVLVAMSGGVDSSVAAAVLLNKGFKVTGITMRLPVSDNVYDEARINDARAVANKLGIKHEVLDFNAYFNENIIRYFKEQYMAGLTPNPCTVCNHKIKFGILLDYLKEFNAGFLATGHYVRTRYDKSKNRYLLMKGKDSTKDQSYFLFLLGQNQLSRLIFPLGCMTKQKVRKEAKMLSLPVHDKPASQDVCFLAGGDYRKYLQKHVNTLDRVMEGNIVNMRGDVVGRHSGIAFYTIGQRKGIGAHKKPHYVVAIDPAENEIEIGEDKFLYSRVVIVKDFNSIDRVSIGGKITAKAKIRHMHKESRACAYPVDGNKIKVVFDKDQRAITPGQALVLYKGDVVVGGGWIEGVKRS